MLELTWVIAIAKNNNFLLEELYEDGEILLPCEMRELVIKSFLFFFVHAGKEGVK